MPWKINYRGTKDYAMALLSIASDSASQSPTLCALQIHLLTYLLYLQEHCCEIDISRIIKTFTGSKAEKHFIV